MRALAGILLMTIALAARADGHCTVLEPTGDAYADWESYAWLDPSCVEYTIEIRYLRNNKDENGSWTETVIGQQRWASQNYVTFSVAGTAIAELTSAIFQGWGNVAAAGKAGVAAELQLLRDALDVAP